MSTSLWMDTAQLPDYPALAGDIDTDVCVVGAGIAGLTAAYLLLREGRQVVVVDALQPGQGETARTTAHFFPPDERYYQVARRFGDARARLLRDSYEQAIDLVEAIVQREGIACDFLRLDGYLVPAGITGAAVIEHEYEAAVRLGIDVARVPRVAEVGWDTGPALCFHRQAQFHPLKYLAGLLQAIGRMGGRIHGGTRARDVDATHVITEHGTVRARAVVVATNTPFNNRFVLHTKVAGYQSYVLGLKLPRGALRPCLLWDTGDPYYYVRLDVQAGEAPHVRPYDVLIVGGQDHKTGQDSTPQHRYDDIEAWTRSRFPLAQEVAWRWSGEVMEPADGVAYLGRNPRQRGEVFVIAGDSGNGMTHCTAGAMLVTDLIAGRTNPWVPLYDPGRAPLHGLGHFAREQANVVAQYADWLQGGEVSAPDRIPPGEGALIRDGLKLLAVHRADDGQLTFLSAACPHLGCAVHWNAGEKSWDCPCHGSRFDIHGQVLHGPSAAPLAAAG